MAQYFDLDGEILHVSIDGSAANVVDRFDMYDIDDIPFHQDETPGRDVRSNGRSRLICFE